MPGTPNEQELLLNLSEGSRTAFDAIYHHYINAVYRNALKLTRDTAAAEDIVQEVFITLWEKRKTIDTSRSIGGWLFVLSYNKSVNLLRKKLRIALATKAIQPPAAESAEDLWRHELQWNLLESAIAQLSPQKRKVFELCKLQGKSYEETAAALNISKYTVKEYLSGAVNFIRSYISQQPESAALAGSLLFIAVLQ